MIPTSDTALDQAGILPFVAAQFHANLDFEGFACAQNQELTGERVKGSWHGGTSQSLKHLLMLQPFDASCTISALIFSLQILAEKPFTDSDRVVKRQEQHACRPAQAR